MIPRPSSASPWLNQTLEWVAAQLDGAKGELKMCTVKLTEATIAVDYRHPTAAAGLQTLSANTPIEFIAPTTQHAFIAAKHVDASP